MQFCAASFRVTLTTGERITFYGWNRAGALLAAAAWCQSYRPRGVSIVACA